jgi:hypothetical protein
MCFWLRMSCRSICCICQFSVIQKSFLTREQHEKFKQETLSFERALNFAGILLATDSISR